MNKKGNPKGTTSFGKKRKKRKESDLCGVCDEGGELLICDGDCLQAFHVECLGFSEPPETAKWYCDDCKKKQKQKIAKLQSLFAKKTSTANETLISNGNHQTVTSSNFISVSPYMPKGSQFISSPNGIGMSTLPITTTNPSQVNTTSSTILPNYMQTVPPISPSALTWLQNYIKQSVVFLQIHCINSLPKI